MEGELDRTEWRPKVRQPRHLDPNTTSRTSGMLYDFYAHLTCRYVDFRSLVALSLILAMLLFKPAPIYILDEVDAALDLSHTQNIGQMLRTHFTHSQVIQ